MAAESWHDHLVSEWRAYQADPDGYNADSVRRCIEATNGVEHDPLRRPLINLIRGGRGCELSEATHDLGTGTSVLPCDGDLLVALRSDTAATAQLLVGGVALGESVTLAPGQPMPILDGRCPFPTVATRQSAVQLEVTAPTGVAPSVKLVWAFLDTEPRRQVYSQLHCHDAGGDAGRWYFRGKAWKSPPTPGDADRALALPELPQRMHDGESSAARS